MSAPAQAPACRWCEEPLKVCAPVLPEVTDKEQRAPGSVTVCLRCDFSIKGGPANAR